MKTALWLTAKRVEVSTFAVILLGRREPSKRDRNDRSNELKNMAAQIFWALYQFQKTKVH